MYQYDALDQAFVDRRVAEFRDQMRRHLAGELSEDEFRPLRLRNGLYVQRHAPMLRIAIPYGLLAARQLAKLADIARRYDRGFGHFTTRQNLQLNWPKLADVPDILAELATVQMHAIQTSGNCVRNVTADHLAGIAPDEVDDPRPYCEIIRQWATLHPEFTYLPRKFKIAVTGSPEDRAASEVHDIGLHLTRDAAGSIGFTVLVGGGLGRTPIIGQVIRDFLPLPGLLSYLEAILRVYNRHGRRDNLNKARIKILVKSLGIERFREQVEAEWRLSRDSSPLLPAAEVERVRGFFRPQPYETLEDFDATSGREPRFRAWYRYNAGTLGVARQIQERFDDLDYLYDLGDIEIKMSGCMNACGHHHVGHIGILGVDKRGEEWYQISLGGSANGFTALGEVIGPSVPKSEVASTIERIVEAYRALRADGERFIDTLRRVGLEPFREGAYATHPAAA